MWVYYVHVGVTGCILGVCAWFVFVGGVFMPVYVGIILWCACVVLVYMCDACLCVCERERERERKMVCVCVCVYEREGGRWLCVCGMDMYAWYGVYR